MEIKRVDLYEKRSYELNGVQYPSSTTVIGQLDKPALRPWYARETALYLRDMIIDRLIDKSLLPEQLAEVDIDELIKQAKAWPKKQKEQKAKLGTLVHEHIHMFYRGEQATIPAEIMAAWEGFLKWNSQFKVKPGESEFTVISKKHKYGGTFDLVGVMSPPQEDEGLWLVDFKTGLGMYRESYIQAVSYEMGYEEMTGVKVAGCGLVLINRETGDVSWYPVPKKAKRYLKKQFLSLVNVWWAEKELKKVYKDFKADNESV